MKLEREFTLRALLVYAVSLAVAWILTEVVWGATGGIVGGLTIARNSEYQQKVTAFLKDRGITSDSTQDKAQILYEDLSRQDRQELMIMSKDLLADINWFSVTLFVSAVVFGVVGFLGGLFARAWVLAGVVLALSFLINNPLIRFPMARDLPEVQKLIVFLVSQFAICYLFAFCGAKLGLKRQYKKEMANKAVEATS
jgi:hypothetical protein